MAQYSEGLKSGILSSNTLLAEIPPVAEYASHQPTLWMTASVSATIEIQRRNAANNGNVWAQRFNLNATSPVSFPTPPTGFTLEANERIRVLLVSSLIGDVQASMLT